MFRRPLRLLAAAVAVSAAVLTNAETLGADATPRPVARASTATSKLLLGEYNGNTFPADIDSYTANAGAQPNIVMWYQNWDNPILWSKQRAGIDARSGVTPMITWSPDRSPFSMRDVAAGKYDRYIKAQARTIKAWHRTVMIRPFHEMNGTWKPYGINDTDPASFIHAWRRMVHLFDYIGATNVQWVWAPNTYGFGSTVSFDRFYPGDSYVDWVGLDGYNSTRWWRNATTLYRQSYDDITKLTSKPVMMAEWGCPEQGGDKASWIADTFATWTRTMPRIKAAIVFDRDKETDYRINSSSTTQSAYRTAVKTYQSS